MKLILSILMLITFNIFSQQNYLDSLNIDTTKIEMKIQDTIINDSNIIYQIETNSIIILENNNSIGDIIYDRYDTLYVGEEKLVKISISKDISIDSVIDKMKFKKCNTEQIRIDRLMQVEILNLDPEKLIIEPTPKPITQPMEDGTYTHWEWIIKSTKPGKICFLIKVRVIIDKHPKNLSLYKYNVISISNDTYFEIILNFLLTYWQWLIGTLVLPFSVFVYKYHTNKKK